MTELTPKQLVPLLVRLWQTGKRAVALVGAPGMAKTECIRQAASQLGAILFVEHPLLREPIDYAGLPWVVDGEARQLPMAFIQSVQQAAAANPDKHIIVFFDDVGQAATATQAAMMQFVQERAFAGQQVPENVRFVMATNRRKDKAGVGGILAPLTNRLTVLGVTVDPDSWAEWALGEGGLPPELPSYVRFKPDCLGDPEKHANRDIEPFCSARSLEAAGRYVAAGISDFPVLEGCLGAGRATELSAFLKVWRELPDIDKIFANPTSAEVPVKSRTDVMYALVGALAAHVTSKTMGALNLYLKRLPIEYQVACMKDAHSQKPELRKTKGFAEWMLANKKMLGLDDEKEDA